MRASTQPQISKVNLSLLVALKALKQKKKYQNNLKTLDNQIAALEQQQEALEEADTTKHILSTMKESNKVLKNTLTDKFYKILIGILTKSKISQNKWMRSKIVFLSLIW